LSIAVLAAKVKEEFNACPGHFVVFQKKTFEKRKVQLVRMVGFLALAPRLVL
jgi:hypothetical protein